MSSSDLIKHYHDRLSAERLNEHLDTIQTHVQILDGQLDNLTILYKVRTQALSFEPQLQDLDHLCRMVIQRVNGYLHVPHEIRYEMVGGEREARCDLNLMRVALANIVGNAVKFSTQQTPVLLFLQVDGGGAQIQVQDEGIGIPLEEQTRVFELFFRASNASGLRGEGIGLAVARQILALHEGRLGLESEPGAGTMVTIWLP
jgi:signal transduction histidine kinase